MGVLSSFHNVSDFQNKTQKILFFYVNFLPQPHEFNLMCRLKCIQHEYECLDLDKMQTHYFIFKASLSSLSFLWSDFFQQSQQLQFFTRWLSSKQNLQIILGRYEERWIDQGSVVRPPIIGGDIADSGSSERNDAVCGTRIVVIRCQRTGHRR